MQPESRWIAREKRKQLPSVRFLSRSSQCPFLSPLFFFTHSPFFLSGFVSRGFRCVRGAPHRRLFLYVHRDKSCATSNAHHVPQARKRPSSVSVVFCHLILLYLSLTLCLSICLSVCLSAYDNISAGFITTMRENTPVKRFRGPF